MLYVFVKKNVTSKQVQIQSIIFSIIIFTFNFIILNESFTESGILMFLAFGAYMIGSISSEYAHYRMKYGDTQWKQ